MERPFVKLCEFLEHVIKIFKMVISVPIDLNLSFMEYYT